MYYLDANTKVVGKLDKTDMGYDVSVFVNEETGDELVGKSDEQEYSMIMIKVVDGYDIDKAVRDINNILKGTGIKAYKTSSMFTSIKEQIELSQSLIIFMTAIISIIGISAILTIFIMNAEGRITEINVYKIMGIDNKKIILIIFLEAFICVMLGGILGSISSITIGVLLRYCIQDVINIIYSVNIIDIISTSLYIVFVIIFGCLISIMISMGVVLKDKRVFR